MKENNVRKQLQSSSSKSDKLYLVFLIFICLCFIQFCFFHQISKNNQRKRNIPSSAWRKNFVLVNVSRVNSKSQQNLASIYDKTQARLEILVEKLEKLQKEKIKDKPNILLVYGDDWRYDVLSAAGNPVVKTPNLNELAKEGILFTNACVTTSICWVSRATLQTGQYLSRHNSTRIDKGDFALLEKWNSTYNFLLNREGYYTGFVGKWHYQRKPPPMEPSFDFWREYHGYHINKHTGVHITKENERDALEFLEGRPDDKPFALTVSFFAPHAVDVSEEHYYPQNDTKGMYCNDTIPMPHSGITDFNQSWNSLPHFFNEKLSARKIFHKRYGTKEKYQQNMKNYYRLITEVDTVYGKLAKVLKSQGVYNNTLIIFTTDNGYFHGEHGFAEKWFPHQESIRVPLIIKDPRMATSLHNTKNHEFVLNIDLAPTMLRAADISVPDVMQGRDIADLYLSRGNSTAWRTQFFYEYKSHDEKEERIPSSEALVRKDYKYIIWPFYQVEQLFCLADDPYEQVDLAQNVTYQKVLQEMRLTFQKLKKEAQ